MARKKMSTGIDKNAEVRYGLSRNELETISLTWVSQQESELKEQLRLAEEDREEDPVYVFSPFAIGGD